MVVRSALALSLLLGAYALGLGLAAALAVLLWFGLAEHGGLIIPFAAITLATVVHGLVLGLLAARRAARAEPTGLLLTVDDAPELWRQVRELAEQVGTRAPDTIRLTPEVNAAVWERRRLLGLRTRSRELVVGAPLLLGTTDRELWAVLAHELGHFAGRDTALLPLVRRTRFVVEHLVRGVGADTWTGRGFAAYGRFYLRRTHAVFRQQELAADTWMVTVAGREAAVSALRRLHGLTAIWDYFLERHAFAVPGARPADLHEGFRRVLAGPRHQARLAELGDDLPDRATDPYDTHPALQRRVVRMASLPDGTGEAGHRLDVLRPATDLVAGLESVLRRLDDVVFAESDLEARSWEALAETGDAQRCRTTTAALVRAAREPGHGAATLGDAVAALVGGRSRSLVRPFITPEATRADVDRLALDGVAAFLATAMAEQCGAHFLPDWDGDGARLADAEGRSIEVRELLEAVLDGSSAEWLLSALEEEGVDRNFTVQPDEVEAELAAVREPRLLSMAVCVRWRRTRVLVVADNALLLKRLSWREGFTAGFSQGGRDPYRKVLSHVVRMPLAQLMADPRTVSYEWQHVDAVRLSPKRVSIETIHGRVRLRLCASAVAGDLVGALQAHLADRLVVGRRAA